MTSFLYSALLALSLCLAVAPAVKADLPFSLSYSKQCAPLNVTWTPVAANYPYTVTIGAIGFGVQSYRIPSTYQPGSPELTFQYVVPPANGLFNSYIIALTDAVGNGNSSRIIGIDSRGAQSDCDPYSVARAFTWAGDSQVGSVGNMVQCGDVKFYPVDQRGTAPFSISLIPLGGVPRTFTVPASATLNTSFFNYTMPIPLAEGTQFYTMLSDAQGTGSGGGSPIYTVAGSSDSSCLNGRRPNEVRGVAIPTGPITASFQDIPGALTEAEANESGGGSSGGSGGGGGSNVGGLVGGVIGAVVGVAIVIAALVAWLIVRRRKRAKRDAARKEEPTFVDLDGDEDGQDGAAAMAAARRRRASGGVSQQYQVSPFTYASAPQSSSPDLGNAAAAYADEPFSNASTRPGSMAGFPPGSPAPGSSNLRYPPRPQSSSGYTDARSGAGYTQGSEADFASSASHAFGPGSVAGGSYRLSARNGEAQAGAVPPVPPMPTKGPLPGGDEAAGSSQRFVQHSDAGPVQSVAVEDNVEELPPSYLPDWSNRDNAAAGPSQ